MESKIENDMDTLGFFKGVYKENQNGKENGKDIETSGI